MQWSLNILQASLSSSPSFAGPQWKFAGAFYFATVVLAMIGYGHSTPVTVGGKAFCMAYAMVGIPLGESLKSWSSFSELNPSLLLPGLVMFQSIGERLNKFASVVIRRGKTYLRCRQTEATEMNLMMATGMLSSIIITTGAAVFSRYEGWSYFESFYYCFITLTTIGFGDYVALQNDSALMNKPGYVALSLVFILFGLAVVAASINLLVLRFMTMNAEDLKRDEAESQLAAAAAYQSEINYMDASAMMAKGTFCVDEDDQMSVCSCNCLGPTCNNHEFLFDPGYQPTDLITSTLSLKRASV